MNFPQRAAPINHPATDPGSGFLSQWGQNGLLGAIAPEFDRDLGEWLRTKSIVGRQFGSLTEKERDLEDAKAELARTPGGSTARVDAAEQALNLERGDNPYYNPDKMGQSVGFAGSPLHEAARSTLAHTEATDFPNRLKDTVGKEKFGGAPGEPGGPPGPPARLAGDIGDGYKPIFPEPAAWPAYKAPAPAAGINVTRDANGRILSAENTGRMTMPSMDVIQRGATIEPFAHEADPNTPVFQRQNAYMAALDARDPASQQLLNQMSPAEQRLSEEALRMGGGRVLDQREHERELAQREQGMYAQAQLGLKVDAEKMAQQQRMAQDLVLGGKTAPEWVNDHAADYLPELRSRLIQDPDRTKRVAAVRQDPSVLTPGEKEQVKRTAQRMAEYELQDAIFRALFPRSVQIQEKTQGGPPQIP